MKTGTVVLARSADVASRMSVSGDLGFAVAGGVSPVDGGDLGFAAASVAVSGERADARFDERSSMSVDKACRRFAVKETLMPRLKKK